MAGLEIESLKDLPLFKTLVPKELESVAPLMFEKPYPKGSTLFVEGMSGEILYVVRQGKVEILKKGKDGQEKVLAALGPGEFLGEMSLIDNQPRTATARVAEDAQLIVMTKKSFSAMLERSPDAAVKILLVFLKTANERLRKANEANKQI